MNRFIRFVFLGVFFLAFFTIHTMEQLSEDFSVIKPLNVAKHAPTGSLSPLRPLALLSLQEEVEVGDVGVQTSVFDGGKNGDQEVSVEELKHRGSTKVGTFDDDFLPETRIDIDHLKAEVIKEKEHHLDQAEMELGALEGGAGLQDIGQEAFQDIAHLKECLLERGIGFDYDEDHFKQLLLKALKDRSIKKRITRYSQKKTKGIPDGLSDAVGQGASDLSGAIVKLFLDTVVKDHKEQSVKVESEQERAKQEAARADKANKTSSILTISHAVTPIINILISAAVTAGVNSLLNHFFPGSGSGGGASPSSNSTMI